MGLGVANQGGDIWGGQEGVGEDLRGWEAKSLFVR